jgi:hypothetical protein
MGHESARLVINLRNIGILLRNAHPFLVLFLSTEEKELGEAKVQEFAKQSQRLGRLTYFL